TASATLNNRRRQTTRAPCRYRRSHRRLLCDDGRKYLSFNNSSTVAMCRCCCGWATIMVFFAPQLKFPRQIFEGASPQATVVRRSARLRLSDWRQHNSAEQHLLSLAGELRGASAPHKSHIDDKTAVTGSDLQGDLGPFAGSRLEGRFDGTGG